MPKFVIEREIPEVGKLTAQQLQGVARKSCGVLEGMPAVQWIQSYVTDNKIYCVYRAPSEDIIREHAQTAGFPANSIARVQTVISPMTAE